MSAMDLDARLRAWYVAETADAAPTALRERVARSRRPFGERPPAKHAAPADGPAMRLGRPSRGRLAALAAVVALAAGLFALSVGRDSRPGPTMVPASPSPSPASSARAGRDIVVAQDGSGEVRTVTEAMELARDGNRILVTPGGTRRASS